jgi:aspartyl-tRNA(Asn)/glutamyl-tRNA(Gln) amidotransferase subunit A
LAEIAAALSGAGHRVTALSGTGLAGASGTLGDIVLTEGIAVHRTAGLWPHRADDYLPVVRSRLRHADNTDGAAVARARRRRARIAVAAERILRHVDVVVSPASAVAAAAIGHDRDPSAPEAVAFRAGVIGCCAWQSLTGLPTCAVRVRFDPNGLPVGLQFTARRGADGVALDAAALAMRLTADIQDRWPSPGVREQLP